MINGILELLTTIALREEQKALKAKELIILLKMNISSIKTDTMKELKVYRT